MSDANKNKTQEHVEIDTEKQVDDCVPYQESEVWKDFKDKWKVYYPKHKNQVTWASVGLIIAILILALGFFKTLLIVLLTGIGYIYGRYLDGDKKVNVILQRIFKRR